MAADRRQRWRLRRELAGSRRRTLCPIGTPASVEHFLLDQFEIPIHVEHIWLGSDGADPNSEIRVGDVLAVEEDQPETARDTQRFQSVEVFRQRGFGDHQVRAMREEAV